MFTPEEIKIAKEVRDGVFKENIPELISIYTAGEIVMWDKCEQEKKKQTDSEKNIPYEWSKAKCDLCGHEWIPVRPKGVTKLECPNCQNIGYFENI